MPNLITTSQNIIFAIAILAAHTQLTACSSLQESLCPTPESGAFIIHTQGHTPSAKPKEINPPIANNLTELPSNTQPSTPPRKAVYAQAETTPETTVLITSIQFQPGRARLTKDQVSTIQALPSSCYQLIGYEKGNTPPYHTAMKRTLAVERLLIQQGHQITSVQVKGSNTHSKQDTRVDILRCSPQAH